MTELKPCPFCGESGIVENLHDSNKYYHRNLPYRVKCSSCSCALAYKFFETEQEAINAWNRRVENAKS